MCGASTYHCLLLLAQIVVQPPKTPPLSVSVQRRSLCYFLLSMPENLFARQIQKFLKAGVQKSSILQLFFTHITILKLLLLINIVLEDAAC